MDQTPFKDVIHKRFIRISRMKISQDDAPAWPQTIKNPVEQFDDEFVIEIIDQTDAIDQILWGQFQFLTAGGQIDQIGMFHANVEFLTANSCLEQRQGFLVNVESRELQCVGAEICD